MSKSEKDLDEKDISNPNLYKNLTSVSARGKLLELGWKEALLFKNPEFKIPFLFYKEFRDDTALLIYWKNEEEAPTIKKINSEKKGIIMPEELEAILRQLLLEFLK